jgi:DNA-binding response OmpR family regulator
MRILVCEDNPDIQEILGSFLTAAGYDVVRAATGPESLKQFGHTRPDLVLLDAMLPEKDGWQVLQEIRARSDTPVIMLTALGRVQDKVRALSELGADDYLTKASFDLAEVRARIEAVLRRYRPAQRREPPRFEIDEARKRVRIRGEDVLLSPKEYSLVTLLASAPGRVFSSAEIVARLWPNSRYANPQDVQKYVHLVRKKIEEDPSDPKLLVTSRGFGYRLAV